MPGLIDDAKDVLLKLFDADAEYSADTLENIYDDLEIVSGKVLKGDVDDKLASEVLAAIARHEDMSSRIRRNVMDTRRAVSFMMRTRMLTTAQFEDARQILRDLDSLDGHTAFLFDKINLPPSVSSTSTRTRSSKSSRWPACLCCRPPWSPAATA
jgi:magnesium transporter